MPAGVPSACRKRAECRQHAEPGVIRRAAADANDEVAAAALRCSEDELTEAVRCRMERIALFGRYAREACCISHLDDSGLLRGQQAEAARNFLAEWPRDVEADDLAREAGRERIDRALAAISERKNLRFAVREDVADGRRDDAAGLDGRDAALEGIHGDDEMMWVHENHLC